MFVPLTPLRCLHRAVDLFGDKIGVVSGDRQFTYSQFGERCERLASALPKFGVAAGDRVAFLSFNNHQLIEGYYGVVQARGIVMPLNVRLSELELTNILNHSGAKILMFENDFAPMIEKLRVNCQSIEKWVSLDDAIPCADLCYEALLVAGNAGTRRYFFVRRDGHRRTLLYQRQHRHAQGSGTLAPDAVSACARYGALE